MIRLTLVYSLAFALGLATAYLVLRLNSVDVFDPIGGVSNLILISLILPPLAGLSVFALFFGLVMRWPLGAKFWLISLPLVFGLIVFGLMLIYLGVLTLIEALYGVNIILFVAGWGIFYKAAILKGLQDG